MTSGGESRDLVMFFAGLAAGVFLALMPALLNRA